MKARRLIISLVVVLSGSLAVGLVQEESARRAGETALKNREWDKAAENLQKALAEAKEGRDEILYLLATAQQHGGKHAEALDTLVRLVIEHPKSPLRMKALFKRGDVLAVRRDFEPAAKAYDVQVQALTAPDRRKRLAMIYVEAGRTFLNPEDPKDPTFTPDYGKARTLLAKSLELEALGADEASVRLDIITCERRLGKPQPLLTSCETFLGKFPMSEKRDEVLFATGEALRGTGRRWDARKTWIQVADGFPKSSRAPEALHAAAQLHLGPTPGKATGLEELRRALPLLRRIVKDFPKSKEAPLAAFLIGASFAPYEDLREDARRELEAFRKAYPADERAPDALLRIAQLHRQDRADAKAIATFEDFLKTYPDSPRWPQVRRMIADVRYEGAQRAFARKDWAAARTAAREFVKLHPTDNRAPAMDSRVARTLKEEKEFREAVDVWLKVARKYPSRVEGHRARYSAAEVLATELDEFETAIKELKKVAGSCRKLAATLLATLQSKALAVRTERVYRTGEAPKVRLTLRNLEAVTLRYWTLDLKDYFEKRATTSGLESLEVSVISPDKEWEHKVEGYKRFKEMKIDLELPAREPGAYVVTAHAGTQEATTVVLVSDLALIARAGRKAATVLVQNQRTGEIVENPTVRIAADGKHLKDGFGDTTAGRLSFLVESGGHLAFRDMNVGGLRVPFKRSPKALVLTDRMIYAAGETVRARIVVRDVAGGAYAVPAEKKYRLKALSPQGVVFFEEDLAPSKFGTAGSEFRILEGLAGGVRINLFEVRGSEEKLVGSAAITIGAERRPSRRFEFLVDDRPYFQGEDVPVTVVLRDEWGRPMAGRRVQLLTSADPKWVNRKTGPDGTLAVTLTETARYYREGLAWMWVRYEGLEHYHQVPLLRRGILLGFDASSRMTEPVATGEQKTVVVRARRADDSPVAEKFAYTVVRLNEAGERVPVATGELTTDAEGKGSFAFTGKEGGIHTVTVSRRDADGLPVVARAAVQVVDDAEEQKLRLLSAADRFDAGKPMEFTVLSRLEKGLAFVTVEGEAVEQVVRIELEKGKNTVKLAAPPKSTRDFTVAVLMMKNGKFHADVRSFTVKPAELKLEAGKKEYRPGEEATVKVTATPGSEVLLIASRSLRAWLDANAFVPNRRGVHFVGDSSVGTAFAGKQRQLNPMLIQALARLNALDRNAAPQIMLDHRRVFETERDVEEDPDIVRRPRELKRQFGQRLGGRRSLIKTEGGLAEKERPIADPVPLIVVVAEADAKGVATFTFRLPHDRETYAVRAWAVDPSNAIASGSMSIKARAPVTLTFRAPESAVEGEKTSVIALLTNHSNADQKVTLTFAGKDVEVTVPARSVKEQTLEWTAAASAVMTMGGIRHEQTVALRPKGPVAHVEQGGAFTARTELNPAGDGKLTVRVATGPAAFLESLAEGRDPQTRAGDASARLLALVARHRYEKSEGTRRAVMEFAARRAAGLADAAGADAAWPVLVYLAAAEAKAAGFEIKTDSSLLKKRFARAADDDVKALMLFALARGGEAQYGYIHRLWRAAETLSPRALASVALALKATDRPQEAKAAVDRLATLVKEDHWEAAAIAAADRSNTHYATTALAAFALAEIDPGNALLPKARAWLVGRSASRPSERALLALALQSTPDKSQVTSLTVGGTKVTGTAEVAVDRAVIVPEGAGTFYALARRETDRVPDPAVKVAVERKAGWPTLVVEGVSVWPVRVAVKEPVENPSMDRVAAGERFTITYTLKITGPTKQYHRIELPRATGLRVHEQSLRVLIPPQPEGERTIRTSVAAYADAPGAYPGIEVLAAGTDYRNGWTMTHGERLGAGRVRYAEKQWKEAVETLKPLFDRGTLLDPSMIEAARMLAYSAVETAEHETVVRAFEILKEKSPAEVVPFDKIRGVGRAYAARKEHERAMQVHSGTADAYFLQEANVATALEGLGRTRDAAREMKALLASYPDSPLNRQMLFGFGQKLYTRGRDLKDPVEKDAEKLTRKEMLAEATAALERYLAWFPDDKECDMVSLSLGGAYLEAGRHDELERVARQSAARYPKSRHLDSFDYLHAVALFAQKKFKDSLALCDRLETFDYGRQANPGPALMREQAALIKAHIFHASGELDKAIQNYRKVKKKYPDAARSIEFLEREAIAIPETTVIPLARPAEIELEYAGVAEARVRAYKVDLTTLALRRKDLAGAASVEVAGIKPHFDRTYKLDKPGTRKKERQKLAMELKEPGAYLIGVQAGDFFAGGLVLRSDLSMAVQEKAGQSVRVNVSNAATGGFVEGVKVTVFGTGGKDVTTQKTDLRGISESTVRSGVAVVVAEKDGHVAIHRGRIAHGLAEQNRRQSQRASGVRQQEKLLNDYLKGLNDDKAKFYLDNAMKQQEGVEVQRTKK